jgi:hypothetical protein
VLVVPPVAGDPPVFEVPPVATEPPRAAPAWFEEPLEHPSIRNTATRVNDRKESARISASKDGDITRFPAQRCYRRTKRVLQTNTGIMKSDGTMRPAMSWLMDFLGR